jgi:hypothetical protein
MTTTLAQDAWTLAFGPLSLEDGMALREGTAWRLMRGDDPARYAGLLSVDDIDAFLRSDAARTPRISMADGARKGSAGLPVDDYIEEGGDRVDLPRLFDCHAGGASLVVSQFHEVHPPLARFCRGLEKAFLHGVQANIYLTPPGDALYLPRGVMHEAMVQAGGEPSLHITVGFLEPALGEMLRGLLADLEYEEPALRAAVPTWRLADADGIARLRDGLGAALGALGRPDIADRLAVMALDRLVRDRMALPGRRLHTPAPGPDDRLRLSETMHHALVPITGGGATLRWYGGIEKLTDEELGWLSALEDGATATELGDGALDLCRRLAGAGLLERV